MPRFATVSAALRTRWVRVIAALCIVLAAGGCALQSPFRANGHLNYDPALLTGERVFGEYVPAEAPLATPINAPSDAMRNYVTDVIDGVHGSSRRFQHLYDRLTMDGYFRANYAANRTLTAAETFEARGGNCLSYTNMFVALARTAGLDARYQVVDVPPSWDADADFLIRYTHINVVLRNVHMQRGTGDTIVDFNLVQPDPDYPHRVVSDDYAEALFYANKSVSLMRGSEPRKAFAYLRRAIDIAPQNIDLWINLGAFYATQRAFESSIEAYEVALQIEPHSRAAFSGLARSYASAGDEAKASFYAEKVRNYRERNPYYHYALAQAAYADADYQSALEEINAAIGLRRSVARFHLLKSLVQAHLGQSQEAHRSMERARHFGLDRSVAMQLVRTIGG